jgi:hypothetical protein
MNDEAPRLAMSGGASAGHTQSAWMLAAPMKRLAMSS